MKRSTMFVLLTGLLGLFLTGCATHSLMRGSVVMKESDTSAHVCLGQNEVKVGDRLQLYKNVCTGRIGGKLDNRICKRVDGGFGEVTKILNEHYSVVSFPAGTSFGEGDTLEKSTR